MSAISLSTHVGDRATSIAFGVAEVGAMLITGVVMVGVVIVSQAVRLAQESAERRKSRTTSRLRVSARHARSDLPSVTTRP